MRLITELLIDEIKESIEKASSIYIVTAFLMKTGVDLLKHPLKEALDRGAEVKICTGDYMYITQPDALRALFLLDERIEIRLWQSNGRSFHPKAYLFQFDEDHGHAIIGSSNLSRSALTHGVEWNVSIPSRDGGQVYEEAMHAFMKLFLNDHTIPVNDVTICSYEEEYKRKNEAREGRLVEWDTDDEKEIMFGEKDKELPIIRDQSQPYQVLQPRQAQLEALENLEQTVEEGYDKALVVMATGLGKTYLSAFFARRFKRVLFIAHREEILYQAKKTFEHVMPNRTYGVFNGKQKERDADFVFASIFSMANRKQVEEFEHDGFDLIIVDEFHHAAANSYQHVLDYFSYSFLLGLTATPDRMDGKDVYAICDGNVAYKIDFLTAIERGWLSLFRYHGVYDEVDYSKVTWLGKRYDEAELLDQQLRDDVFENIYRAWISYKQSRTLVFCSSIKQANFLAQSFKNREISCISLHSQSSPNDRKQAIAMLESGQIEMILTVDLFNEGVDIPTVDTLLFVRPTESLSVFIQQIGRGLRLSSEKEACVIIDLIGNYRNADLKLRVFRHEVEDKKKRETMIPEVPSSCFIDLETKVIDLMTQLKFKRKPRREEMLSTLQHVREELGRRPTYKELHLQGSFDGSQYRVEFGSYFTMLKEAGLLTKEEVEIHNHYLDWLKEVESTLMTKSYKMVILSYMLSRGVGKWDQSITPVEAAPYFHQYYMSEEYRKKIDFSAKNTKGMWEYNEKKVSSLIATMPMTKWSGSSKSSATFDGETFGLSFDILPEHRETLFEWTKEICDYRLHRYFINKEKS
ncbi:DEAD/DEAH box helicase family protein [Bacillus sp. FJAT-45037]|uniref:DEAD/DEAH box helicase family protein n=1 Tax=Bacillus sp. FJAT-45037 TaxID=2011007 RepID=UPI000C24CC9E|nr:DEAD/DEAH box helicase family protein [Bacillus sp. FJAT-45037]